MFQTNKNMTYVSISTKYQFHITIYFYGKKGETLFKLRGLQGALSLPNAVDGVAGFLGAELPYPSHLLV